MDGARLAPLPHYSWFGLTIEMRPATTQKHCVRDTTHTLAIGLCGSASVRWIHRGLERTYHHSANQIAFFSQDDDHHVRILRSADVPSNAYLLKFPKWHLGKLIESDEGCWSGDSRVILPREDAVLRECMLRLATTPDHGVATSIGSEIAARRLILRLAEIFGGRNPDWLRDESVLTATVTKQIVDLIDARPSQHFQLQDFASLVGCSPSHFARKFRNTVGLSLGRFINRRRLAAALVMLRDDSQPLAQVALDLGFSSQSHFTRLFSTLTSMTPARYRRAFKRTVG